MSEQLEIPHQKPEIPFLSDYPEWDNLVAEPDEMATSVEAAIEADPYTELRRTLSSLYALDNLYQHRATGTEEVAAYEAFVTGQSTNRRLSMDGYMEASNIVGEAVPTPQSYKVLQFLVLITDGLKKHQLMREVDLDPAVDSHDKGLVRMFTPKYADKRARYFQSLDDPEKFTLEQRAEIFRLVGLMQFNFPGWAQSQSSAAHLRLLPEDLDPAIKKRFLLHGIADVMGVLGNKSLTSALAYDQPTHDMFKAAWQALAMTKEEIEVRFNLDNPTVDPILRESVYIALRAEYFGVPLDSYHETMRSPEVPPLATPDLMPAIAEQADWTGYNELFAQVRIANSCRFTPEQFMRLRTAYHALPTYEIGALTQMQVFNLEYDQDYGPALMQRLLGDGETSMKRGLRALSHLFSTLQDYRNFLQAEGTIGQPERYHEQLLEDPQANITIALRDLALKVKEPDFDITTCSIIVDHKDDGTLIPRLATFEESNEHFGALRDARLARLREIWKRQPRPRN